jgi:hypothetical protein
MTPASQGGGQAIKSKKAVRRNIKGNTNTTSQSYNNSNQGVQPLITTPHATSQGTGTSLI